jgi:hypothetical protein
VGHVGSTDRHAPLYLHSVRPVVPDSCDREGGDFTSRYERGTGRPDIAGVGCPDDSPVRAPEVNTIASTVATVVALPVNVEFIVVGPDSSQSLHAH